VDGRTAPVFLRSSGGTIAAYSACLIRAGDSVDVWHDGGVAYGSVEAPPDSPAYSGTQLLVVRP
jgi:hypothetical protein